MRWWGSDLFFSLYKKSTRLGRALSIFTLFALNDSVFFDGETLRELSDSENFFHFRRAPVFN
jgi:hypothetical protein